VLLTAAAESLGYVITCGVNGKTGLVLAGYNAGVKKLEKARAMNIPIHKEHAIYEKLPFFNVDSPLE